MRTASAVNWAVQKANKAIVFIHGFNGSSMTTFGDFNLEFRYLDEYADRDVYFYSYDSLYKQIKNSAMAFKDFLNILMTDLQKVVDDSKVEVSRDAGYTEIVITNAPYKADFENFVREWRKGNEGYNLSNSPIEVPVE